SAPAVARITQLSLDTDVSSPSHPTGGLSKPPVVVDARHLANWNAQQGSVARLSNPPSRSTPSAASSAYLPHQSLSAPAGGMGGLATCSSAEPTGRSRSGHSGAFAGPRCKFVSAR